MHFKNDIEGFAIRFAKREDTPLILDFIKGLAKYEKMLDQVVATEESLFESIFERKQAEVIIGEEEGLPVGFALFFHNYSTFLGKANLYLEDLYVDEKYRGKGYGKSMLEFLGKIALDRNCGRLDWSCLDWNTAAIEFYKDLGAVPLQEWLIFRVEGEKLKTLGDSFKQKG